MLTGDRDRGEGRVGDVLLGIPGSWDVSLRPNHSGWVMQSLGINGVTGPVPGHGPDGAWPFG